MKALGLMSSRASSCYERVMQNYLLVWGVLPSTSVRDYSDDHVACRTLFDMCNCSGECQHCGNQAPLSWSRPSVVSKRYEGLLVEVVL